MENKIIVTYLDDEGNEVDKDKATRMNILELDENGNRINETYMRKGEQLSDEEAEEYWNNFMPELNEEEPEKKEYTIEELYKKFTGEEPKQR